MLVSVSKLNILGCTVALYEKGFFPALDYKATSNRYNQLAGPQHKHTQKKKERKKKKQMPTPAAQQSEDGRYLLTNLVQHVAGLGQLQEWRE